MVGFVGGLAEGLQGFPQEIGQLVEAHRQRQAAEALANWAAAQGRQQPPQAGPPPQPQAQGNPMAALAAIGGGGAPPPKPDPLAPLPAPGGGGAPPQAGPPQPMGPPPPNPNLSATAQPDQKFNDPIQEAQQTLGAMIRSVKAANPKIDPQTLIAAVNTQLDSMKGILPETKAVMQGQVTLLKTQSDMAFKYAKLNAASEQFAEKMADLAKRHASQNEYDAAREEYLHNMSRIQQERADDYGESVDYQHEDRQAADGTRRYVADTTNATRRDTNAATNESHENISADRSDDSTYRSDQSFRGAQVRSGQTPDAPPQRRAGASPKPGGGVPANVQQFAKQHGLTVIRKRADGKYDAKAKDGTVGVIG